MAKLHLSRGENVPGEFFVDSTCIDCEACRWLAPKNFREAGGQSFVYEQPVSTADRRDAMRALISCPTASIGRTWTTGAAEVREVGSDFPLVVEHPVYYCGYHSEKSYGASSYFIVRPEGNVLVDSPRFAAPLVRKLENMGGVRWMILSHRDDVADHEKFRSHFRCDRVMHKDDVTADTQSVELQIEKDDTLVLDGDLTLIPVPGHTRGHIVLLYQHFLFTGDHLAFSERRQSFTAFRSACWYSWEKQTESMRKLFDLGFEWILPGHGRRWHGAKETARQNLIDLAADMEKTRTPHWPDAVEV